MDETRLMCPGCGAEYLLDAALIPVAGRRVECSSCGRVWFQPGSAALSGPLSSTVPPIRSAARAATPAPAAGMPAPSPAVTPDGPRLNRPLPPHVLDILTTEAARERGVRLAEATARGGPGAGQSAAAAPVAPAPSPAAPAADDPARHDILPSVPPDAPARHIHDVPTLVPADAQPEELEATVTRTTPSRPPQPPSAAAATSVPAVTLDDGAMGRRGGLVWGLALAALALGLYLAVPYLADSGPLVEARATVDQGRLWLFEQASALVDPLVRIFR